MPSRPCCAVGWMRCSGRLASPCASTSSACCWSSSARQRPSSTPRCSAAARSWRPSCWRSPARGRWPVHEPRDVPDVEAAPLVLDTDGDGRPDTSLVDDGIDLVFGTDLDADGVVDQILRLGPDGAIHLDLLDGLT